MSKAIEQKKVIVKEIADKLTRSKTTIVADYRGLNVKQMNELRKELREAGVEMQVLKNTLTRRAAEQVGMEDLNQHLTGPSAVAFSYEDVVAPAKVLHKFAKNNKELEIKGGIVEGRAVSLDEIKALAELPNREGLLSMLLSVLQAPMRNFALAVKAVADKDGEAGEAQEA
ncbi:50S ribosomal protein L10 [Laceyella sacchari]|uniref:Large ribosomal subunit protein uL10 n=1 Tax=Laceyella tengchongensis TaxID=574699 RepID=A0AA45WRY2_9BACL|nr:50S ribosomal protein L10 [Laceyella tengchongensis]AUS07619.1 50S ribosomal protein L10 [Laceyella sacchari]SMP30233.1 LSU ribosomal protein L10P [Laceyella tengchongensis]